MKNYVILFFFCFVLISVLCSCSASKENVRLSDSTEVKKYATEQFGDAELVSTDRSSDAEAVYTFKDKEYKFGYIVRSFVSANLFDGENLGYSERKSSDFSERFQNYIESQIYNEVDKYEKQYHFEFVWYGGTSADVAGTLVFGGEDVSNAEQAAKEIAESILRIDDRGYFKAVEIKSGRGLYGRYDLKTMTYEQF